MMSSAVRFFSYLFVSSHAFFSTFFSRRKCKLVFVSSPDFSDNSFHVYQRMLQRGFEAKYIWLVTQNTSGADKVPSGALLVKKNSIRGIYHFLTAIVVFHTHGCFGFL